MKPISCYQEMGGTERPCAQEPHRALLGIIPKPQKTTSIFHQFDAETRLVNGRESICNLYSI